MFPPEPKQVVSRRTHSTTDFLACEEVLGAKLRPVLTELFMTNAATLVAYVCRSQTANISDLVESSTELVLRPGLLRYSGGAALEFDWGLPPALTLPMEFLHQTLTAFFQIVFEGHSVGVELLGIHFNDAVADKEIQRCFAAAVADAARE